MGGGGVEGVEEGEGGGGALGEGVRYDAVRCETGVVVVAWRGHGGRGCMYKGVASAGA